MTTISARLSNYWQKYKQIRQRQRQIVSATVIYPAGYLDLTAADIKEIF